MQNLVATKVQKAEDEKSKDSTDESPVYKQEQNIRLISGASLWKKINRKNLEAYDKMTEKKEVIKFEAQKP